MDTFIIQWMNMIFSQLHNNKRIILLFIITSCSFFLTTQVAADMFGIFKKYDVHLSPEIHGQILLNGKPVSNQEVLRGLTYGDDKEIIDKTMTDDEGNFFLPEKVIRSRKPGSMFDESRTRQVIVTHHDNKDLMLWYTQSIGIAPNKALSEKLNKLNCDLTNSEEETEFSSYEYPRTGYLLHSICRW